jgi:hypothetical protein
MNQKTLFARSSDPVTSHEAAAEIEIKIGTLHAAFVKRVAAWFNETGAWPTANEVAQGDESLRKRAGECVRKGLLEVGPAKTCSVTGKSAQTYCFFE